MANPATVTIGTTWTLVASNVTSGRVRVTSTEGSIKYTYRETGGAAPTGETDSDWEDMMENKEYLTISNSSPVDVYLLNTRVSVDVTVWL
jgi:hypothetical protein